MKKILKTIFVLSITLGNKSVTNCQGRRIQKNLDKNNSDHNRKKKKLLELNGELLQVLKNRDYKKFSEFIHPEKGIRFSMYAFVDVNQDKHFSKKEFEKFLYSKTLFTWGSFDGSGLLYKQTISHYLRSWVFTEDFTKSIHSLNVFQYEGGNVLNNITTFYPNSDFIENYIKASGRHYETDWKILCFIFEEFKGEYYIKGVVNNRWTV